MNRTELMLAQEVERLRSELSKVEDLAHALWAEAAAIRICQKFMPRLQSQDRPANPDSE
jgi:hypothetical protein